MTMTDSVWLLPGITARGYQLAGAGVRPVFLPRRPRLSGWINADSAVTVQIINATDATSFMVEKVTGYELANSLTAFRRLHSVKSVVRLAKWAAHLHPRLIDMIASALASGEPLADALANVNADLRDGLLAAIATDPPAASTEPWQIEFDRRLARLNSGLALAESLASRTNRFFEAVMPAQVALGPAVLPLSIACGVTRLTTPIVPGSPHLHPGSCGLQFAFQLAL